MRTLLVFDEYFIVEKLAKAFKKADEVYLFSLTSRRQIIAAVNGRLNKIGCNIHLIPSAKMINDSVESLRDQYMRFIADLPKRIRCKTKNLKEIFAIDQYASLWWLSLIAEKNPYKSDAFNRFAQLDAIVNIVKGENIKKVIFSADGEKLRVALREYSQLNSIEFNLLPIKIIKRLRRCVREFQGMFYLKHTLLMFFFAIRFFIRTWKLQKKVAGLARTPSTDNSLCIVTAYPYFDLSMAQKGIFKNSFCKHLQESLENNGQTITWILNYVPNNSMSFDESLNYAKQFIKNGYNIFFPDEFITIGIQIKAMLRMFINGLKFIKIEKDTRQAHAFRGYNFYSILKDDWYSSFVGHIGYFGILKYNIFKKIIRKFKSKACLYYCEMHAWEKALIFARNAVRSETILFGYQSGSVSRMLLNYFNHPSELLDHRRYSMPLPEKIICNGQLPYNYMKESGWPSERLLVAEAIRYNHLKESLKAKVRKKRNVILLAFSISPEENSSILNIAYESFKEIDNKEVWVKLHPFLNFRKLLELSGISEKSFPFIVKQGSIENFLPEARVVIVGQSGVALEALAFGCEIIIVNIPEWINMSPLKHVKSPMIKTVNSTDELKEAVVSIFREEDNPKLHAVETKKIINNFFYLKQDSNFPEKFLELLKNSI